MELDQKKERCDDEQSAAKESKQFWENIWSQSADHKKDAKWLKDLQREDRYYCRKFEKDSW